MGRDPLVAAPAVEAVDARTQAFRTARRTFVAGERVELAELAERLGVNRVTVHRWLGNRTQLLTDVVWSLSEPALARCYGAAAGVGGDRLAAAMSTYVADTMAHPGMRAFLEREHETALRILTRRDHDFQHRLVGAVQGLVERERDAGHPVPDHPPADLAYLVVRVMEAFVYVERIVGERPDPAAAATALHFLLR